MKNQLAEKVRNKMESQGPSKRKYWAKYGLGVLPQERTQMKTTGHGLKAEGIG